MLDTLNKPEQDFSIETKTLPFTQTLDLTVSGFSKNSRLSKMIKRLFDVVVAVCALLVTWPLILISALGVKLTSPGSAFYRAKRAGLRGQPFYMLKLRTMRLGTDTRDRKIISARDDRITPVGALLRKFKIDELPHAARSRARGRRFF